MCHSARIKALLGLHCGVMSREYNKSVLCRCRGSIMMYHERCKTIL